jgi:hypothetical protein
MVLGSRSGRPLPACRYGRRRALSVPDLNFINQEERENSASNIDVSPEVRPSGSWPKNDHVGRDAVLLVLILAGIAAFAYVQSWQNGTVQTETSRPVALVHCKLRDFTNEVITNERSCITNGGHVTTRD